MKTLRFLSQLVLTAVLISGTAINASAQKKEDWKQKIMQEKIAFFTTEMDLTQEEAQNFWPVYNQFCKEEHEAQKLIMTTYKDLNEAIESGKSEKEISACLNRYLKAREEKRDLSTAAALYSIQRQESALALLVRPYLPTKLFYLVLQVLCQQSTPSLF